MTIKGSAAAATVLVFALTVIATVMRWRVHSDFLQSKTPRYGTRSHVAGENDSDDLLVTPHEMQLLLYAEVDTIDNSSMIDKMTVSDRRYVNIIRSTVTRPNPSRPVHLDSICLFVCLLFYGTPAPLGPLVPREV
jgi:hypothetical protein